MVNMDKMMDFAESKWKVREAYTLSTLGVRGLYIGGFGFTALAVDLLHAGWAIEVVTNTFSKRSKLYIYHPILNMIGRGEFTEFESSNKYVTLDYLGHSKDFKRKYLGPANARVMVGGEYISPNAMSPKELLAIAKSKMAEVSIDTIAERIKQRQADEAELRRASDSTNQKEAIHL